ncbi:hypothetical protein [Metabacillus halosaccharovorans]|uniref:Uncharacterized protein n=1 Tax=Metabacillus halosaccharovorans TaxID=930124 RepID=A0ABT3DLS3_9BACI|nr:hypothetical protein [Metabacillus halosaccharovorans]MCV9888013.1 hypothetical protein [Metabacillus halosaccharovorans]
MEINWDFELNTIELACTILAWMVLAFWLWRIYNAQHIEERPDLWKVIFTVFIGLFSFSLTLPLFDEVLSLAVLPLGVWILYGILKRYERWQAYRKYAWIGFLGNYIFFGAAILAIGLSGLVYPKDSIETYLADVSNVELIPIHPSGKKVDLNITKLQESLVTFEHEQSNVVQWYEEIREQKWPTEENKEPGKAQEKFPYLLTGVKAKAGEHVQVYVELDGKGLLVTTEDRQYYFRSNTASFLKERGSEE